MYHIRPNFGPAASHILRDQPPSGFRENSQVLNDWPFWRHLVFVPKSKHHQLNKIQQNLSYHEAKLLRRHLVSLMQWFQHSMIAAGRSECRWPLSRQLDSPKMAVLSEGGWPKSQRPAELIPSSEPKKLFLAIISIDWNWRIWFLGGTNCLRANSCFVPVERRIYIIYYILLHKVSLQPPFAELTITLKILELIYFGL